jgi:hypothetical protein
MPYLKVIPTDLKDVRRHLEGFPDDLEIELESGVPLGPKTTIGDLRSLPAWPTGLRLIYNREPGLLWVRIERQ